MLQTLYPTIGTVVNFVRTNTLEAPEVGKGTVFGFGLDPNKRIMAHIELLGTTERVNVDLNCLEPTEEFIAAYAQTIKEIKSLSNEGNEKVKVLVEDYNKRVDNLYSKVLGEPIIFAKKEVETDFV
jgi:hypothetical protein